MKTDPPNRRSQLSRAWWLFFGWWLGLTAVSAGYAGWLCWTKNFHELVPERVYRSAQVDRALLEEAVKRYGIRTVINLRGGNIDLDWYQQEAQATHDLNLSQHDIHLSAYRLPPVSELQRLIQVLDRCDYPVLLHCQHGADRTGLVSALVLLLYGDATLEEAQRQFSLAFGRLSIGQTAELDRFYKLYRDWLQERNHSPKVFREWLEQAYCPDGCCAELEWFDPPLTVPIHQPVGLRMRAHNRSTGTWEFQPGETAGMHALYYITDAKGKLFESGRAALFDGLVQPNGSIELTVPLPALPHPGTYHLLVDLEDGRQGMFFQFGSKPLIREVRAVP